MKKLLVALAAVAVLVAIPAVVLAGHSSPATATAQLSPLNNSGITATINFEDDGTTLTVTGTGTGMNPNTTDFHRSLVYDKGSPPKGPNACIPNLHDLTDDQMKLDDNWVVDGDGNGTLAAETLAYVSLKDIRTISVRLVTGGPNLQACGLIVRTHTKGP